MDKKGTKKYTREPKKKLERLLACVALFLGYWFFYAYQDKLGLDIPWYDARQFLALPVIPLLVYPCIYYFLVKADPLQRGAPNNRAVRFFQAEFPSRYLLERCGKCVETDTSCPNYLKEAHRAHTRYWFYHIFHGPIEQGDPDTVRDTFEKGYTCKLIYSTWWIVATFALLSVVVLLARLLLLALGGVDAHFTPLELLFPGFCTVVYVALRNLHKPDDENPTGCWHAWREINRMSVQWMRQNEQFLVDLICHAGNGTKTFQPK